MDAERGNQGQRDCKSFGLKRQYFLEGPGTQSHSWNNEKTPENGQKMKTKQSPLQGSYFITSLQKNSGQIFDETFQDSLEEQGHRHSSERHGRRMCMQIIRLLCRQDSISKQQYTTLLLNCLQSKIITSSSEAFGARHARSMHMTVSVPTLNTSSQLVRNLWCNLLFSNILIHSTKSKTKSDLSIKFYSFSTVLMFECYNQ